jgi:uncharacterized protein (TIGR02001 family)
MQNYCKTIGALAAASALVAGNASAEVEYELHTGYTSEYLFRGQDLGNDLIEVGADVAGEWNNIGLSAGAWYANVLGAPGIHGSVDESYSELDLYAEASYDFGCLTASVGYIYYYYPENWYGQFLSDQQEVYFGVSHDFGFVNSSFTYFWDVEGDNNGYSELALSRSFELSPCLALNVGTNISYLFEESEFGSWTTKTSLDWGFAGTAKLSPFVALSVAIEDSLSDELVGGSMLSVSF